jgi:hypothetical protein
MASQITVYDYMVCENTRNTMRSSIPSNLQMKAFKHLNVCAYTKAGFVVAIGILFRDAILESTKVGTADTTSGIRHNIREAGVLWGVALGAGLLFHYIIYAVGKWCSHCAADERPLAGTVNPPVKWYSAMCDTIKSGNMIAMGVLLRDGVKELMKVGTAERGRATHHVYEAILLWTLAGSTVVIFQCIVSGIYLCSTHPKKVFIHTAHRSMLRRSWAVRVGDSIQSGWVIAIGIIFRDAIIETIKLGTADRNITEYHGQQTGLLWIVAFTTALTFQCILVCGKKYSTSRHGCLRDETVNSGRYLLDVFTYVKSGFVIAIGVLLRDAIFATINVCTDGSPKAIGRHIQEAGLLWAVAVATAVIFQVVVAYSNKCCTHCYMTDKGIRDVDDTLPKPNIPVRGCVNVCGYVKAGFVVAIGILVRDAIIKSTKISTGDGVDVETQVHEALLLFVVAVSTAILVQCVVSCTSKCCASCYTCQHIERQEVEVPHHT